MRLGFLNNFNFLLLTSRVWNTGLPVQCLGAPEKLLAGVLFSALVGT